MKLQNIFSLAVALALVPATGWSVVTEVSAQPQPPLAMAPMDFSRQLSPQAREVAKLVSSGIPNDVVKAYIENAPSTFNLSSDGIIHLQQQGISGALLTEMLNHDRSLRETAGSMPPPGAQIYPPTAQTQPGYAQPDYGQYAQQPDNGSAYAQPDTDYYDQLSPYGNWNNVPGYGYAWQPSYGLDYAGYPWGVLGLGYWWNCPGFGWCWFPRGGFHGGFGFRGGFGRGFGGGFGRDSTAALAEAGAVLRDTLLGDLVVQARASIVSVEVTALVEA